MQCQRFELVLERCLQLAMGAVHPPDTVVHGAEGSVVLGPRVQGRCAIVRRQSRIVFAAAEVPVSDGVIRGGFHTVVAGGARVRDGSFFQSPVLRSVC
jgi:hypothetical protein